MLTQTRDAKGRRCPGRPVGVRANFERGDTVRVGAPCWILLTAHTVTKHRAFIEHRVWSNRG